MTVTIKQLLDTVSPKPLEKNESQRIWFAIQGEITRHPVTKKNRLFLIPTYSFRIATVALAVIFCVAATTATVVASDNAKHGDVLYPIDLAVEKIQLAVAQGNIKEELTIAYARERVIEVEELMAHYTSPTIVKTLSGKENSDEHILADLTMASTTAEREDISTLPKMKDLERAEKALSFSLEYLEKTRQSARDTKRADEVDHLITNLTDLARDYVADVERAVTMEDDTFRQLQGAEDRDAIRTITGTLRKQFRFDEQRQEIRDRDNKEEINSHEDKEQMRAFPNTFSQTTDDQNEDQQENDSDKNDATGTQNMLIPQNDLGDISFMPTSSTDTSVTDDDENSIRSIKIEKEHDNVKVKVIWLNGDEDAFTLAYTQSDEDLIARIADYLGMVHAEVERILQEED